MQMGRAWAMLGPVSFEQSSEHRTSSRIDNPPIGAVLGFEQPAHRRRGWDMSGLFDTAPSDGGARPAARGSMSTATARPTSAAVLAGKTT